MGLVRGICSFSAVVLGIFSALIFVRIIVSWILFFVGRRRWSSTIDNNGNDQTQGFYNLLSSADSFLGKICDPYLKLFSGVKSLRRSNLDLTPLLALVVLNLVRTLLGTFAEIGSFTGGLVLAVLLEVIWTFNQFDLVFNMTKGGPSNNTMIIPVYTYLSAFSFFKLNKAAAIGVIGLVFVGIFAVWYIVRSNRGEID